MSKSSSATTTVKRRRIILLQIIVLLGFVGLIWLRFENNLLSEDSTDQSKPQETMHITLMEKDALIASELSSASQQQQQQQQQQRSAGGDDDDDDDDDSKPHNNKKLSDRYKGPRWEVETRYVGPYEVLDDPNNELPPPAFHGCNDRGLCKFSNVCVSGFPNILMVAKNNHYHQREGVNYSWPGNPVPRSHQPRLIEAFPNNTRLHIVDSIFAVNCLVARRYWYNPVHVMFGIGKLFVAATGHYNFDWGNTGDGDGDDKMKSERTKPLIVYQHCPDVNGFAWGSMVEKIVWDYAYSHSFVAVPWKDRNIQRIILPHVENDDEVFDGTEDHVIFCGRTLQSDLRNRGMSRFLGTNDAEPVEKWERYVNDVIFKDEKGVGKDLRRERQEAACQSRNLRIAIWQRSDNPHRVSHLRLFRNMDEIRSLVSNYTENPLRTMSVTIETPPKEQAVQFRTFDILISPLGAHLANMIFGDFNRTVYIQVSPVFMGGDYENNAAFSKRVIASYGHPTWNNSAAEAVRANCTKSKRTYDQYCTEVFKTTDITADIELLRSALDEAVETICSDFNSTTRSSREVPSY